jgi:hypothetical protein
MATADSISASEAKKRLRFHCAICGGTYREGDIKAHEKSVAHCTAVEAAAAAGEAVAGSIDDGQDNFGTLTDTVLSPTGNSVDPPGVGHSARLDALEDRIDKIERKMLRFTETSSTSADVSEWMLWRAGVETDHRPLAGNVVEFSEGGLSGEITGTGQLFVLSE